MEHYWDEGFGYLYGLDTDISNATIEGTGILVDKYLKKLPYCRRGSLPGIDKTIHDAFKLGRAAIVAKDYKLRDEQAFDCESKPIKSNRKKGCRLSKWC